MDKISSPIHQQSLGSHGIPMHHWSSAFKKEKTKKTTLCPCKLCTFYWDQYGNEWMGMPVRTHAHTRMDASLHNSPIHLDGTSAGTIPGTEANQVPPPLKPGLEFQPGLRAPWQLLSLPADLPVETLRFSSGSWLPFSACRIKCHQQKEGGNATIAKAK